MQTIQSGRLTGSVEDDPRIHLIIESHRLGKPSAINKILRGMSGEILVLLSGDIRLPNSRFVDALASHFKDGVGVVGCRPVPINKVDTKGGYIGHLMWNLHDRTLEAQIQNGLRMQAGEAFAISRQAAEYVPLNVINDDAYLVLRAQLKGHKFVYAREYHYSEQDTRESARRLAAEGKNHKRSSAAEGNDWDIPQRA